jgi:Predicted ATPase
MTETKLVVISGGPGAGKTALIEELRRRGYSCSSEVAREIIQEQVRASGDALPWAERESYARQMLDRSVAAFEESSRAGSPVFFDRGIPDTLCYARLVGLSRELEHDAAVMCDRYRYWRRVFLAPPWREIYETDSERRQNFDEAVRTYSLMQETYEGCGYEVVRLPLVSVEERAAFLLDEIGEADITPR